LLTAKITSNQTQIETLNKEVIDKENKITKLSNSLQNLQQEFVAQKNNIIASQINS